MKNYLKISDEERTRILEMHSAQKTISEQVTSDGYLDVNVVKPLQDKGYKIVDKIGLSDGPYFLNGSGYSFELLFPNRKPTNYWIVTVDGLRKPDAYPVNVKNGEIVDFITTAYRVLMRPTQ